MKKLLAALIIILAMAGQVLAAGSCVKTGSTEKISIDSKTQRIIVTLTCTGDGTIAAYTFNPATYGVRGWYLYSVTTDPGTSAPTADYDITLVTDGTYSAGEDIAGGKLADRSATATQTVAISSSTIGYWMVDEPFNITFANETANPSTIVMRLRFTSN